MFNFEELCTACETTFSDMNSDFRSGPGTDVLPFSDIRPVRNRLADTGLNAVNSCLQTAQKADISPPRQVRQLFSQEETSMAITNLVPGCTAGRSFALRNAILVMCRQALRFSIKILEPAKTVGIHYNLPDRSINQIRKPLFLIDIKNWHSSCTALCAPAKVSPAGACSTADWS